jgi:hypothetical protein
LVVPLTTATNDRDWPPGKVVTVGEIETASGPDGLPAIDPGPSLAAELVPVLAAGAEDAAAVEDAGEFAKVLRPICEPLHAVRNNAPSNRKTFSFISASCPPENHNDWVFARQPGLVRGLKGRESLPSANPNGLLIGSSKMVQRCHVPFACVRLPLGQWNRVTWVMEYGEIYGRSARELERRPAGNMS